MKQDVRAAACAAILTLTILWGAPAAVAEPVLDQSQLDGSDQLRAINSGGARAQSFTVGADGFLAGVELILQGGGPSNVLRLQIVDADGDVLGTSRLGQQNFKMADFGSNPSTLDPSTVTATYVDFSGYAIAVTAGQELAIVLETNAPSSGFSVALSLDSDSYGGGRIFTNGSPETGDFAFKTFVDSDLELAPAVDQHQLIGFDQFAIVPIGGHSGQTFVAGATGQLVGVELALLGTGTTEPLLVEVLDASGGLDGPVLGQTEVLGTDVVLGVETLHYNEIRGNFIDLADQHIVVVEGDVLALRLSTEAAGAPFWSARRAISNLYDDGQYFDHTASYAGLDMAFKTFVADPVFADNFETGDLSRWSEVIP